MKRKLEIPELKLYQNILDEELYQSIQDDWGMPFRWHPLFDDILLHLDMSFIEEVNSDYIQLYYIQL